MEFALRAFFSAQTDRQVQLSLKNEKVKIQKPCNHFPSSFLPARISFYQFFLNLSFYGISSTCVFILFFCIHLLRQLQMSLIKKSDMQNTKAKSCPFGLVLYLNNRTT